MHLLYSPGLQNGFLQSKSMPVHYQAEHVAEAQRECQGNCCFVKLLLFSFANSVGGDEFICFAKYFQTGVVEKTWCTSMNNVRYDAIYICLHALEDLVPFLPR